MAWAKQRDAVQRVANFSVSLKNGTGKDEQESLSGKVCKVEIFLNSTDTTEWLLNHNKSYFAFL